MPEKIKTLYGSLVEEGYELPNYDQFLKDMSDNNKRTKFHASLVEEGYELPDYKTFSIDMGFDEKKKGFQTDLGSAYETTSGGSFPKYQGMRLEGSTPMTKKGPRQPSSPSNVDKGTFQQVKQKLSKESPIVKIGTYEGALSIVNQRFNQNLELFNQAKQAGDEQAMAQLQPLLEIDSKKAEGLKKGIDAQKLEANFTEADDIANNFNIGVYRAMGTMMQGPKAFDESVAVILADVAGIPQESVKAYMENVYPITSSASDKLASAGKFVNKIAEERGQEKNLNRSYGGSAYEALLKGDVKTSANYAFKDFVQSFPSSMTYVNPATATLSSLGMVGEELQAAKDRGEQVDSKTVLAGGIKAGLEIATERWLGGTKSAAKLLNSLGKEGAEQAIREGVEQLAKKSLGRKWLEATGEEVVGESINQLGSNAVDIYLNGNKEKSLFEGVGDAALISVFGGGVQTGLSETANHYLDKAKYNKAQAMREEAASLTDQAMDQPNEVAKEALEEKAAEIQADADNIEKKESELAINASTETVDAIMGVETQMDELSVALETATPETAPILEEKINALEEERVALVEQATLEANEAIKALESVKEPIQEDEAINEAKDSSGDIGSSPNVGGTKESDITAGTNKEQPSENVSVSTQEEVVVQEEPAKEEVKAQESIVEETPASESKEEKVNRKYENGDFILYKNNDWVVVKVNSNGSVRIQPKYNARPSDVITVDEKDIKLVRTANDIKAARIQFSIDSLKEKKDSAKKASEKQMWQDEIDKKQKELDELLTNKQQEDAVKTGKKSESNISEYKGTAEQQQGEQEDRTNKEEPITTSQEEAGNSGGSKQSRESKTQERVARTEKSIDEAAEWLKSKLKIDLPEGTKKSGGGFTDEQLIDLVAKAAKAVAKGAIVTAANIKEVLDTLREGGFLEGVDEEVISKSVLEQETPKEEPKKEKVDEPKSKTSKFFDTISNNKSLEEANKVLSDDIFEYIPKSQDESRKKAKAYIDKVGVEDALENFLSNSVEGLELDEEVALASLLTIIINMGIERNIQEGNLEGRDALEKKYQQLIEVARNRFTKLGQAVNAIKLFLESMSSPELAAYRLENTVRKANEEIKKKPAVKTNASTRVNSGKKTINEGVKTAAEEVAQELNNELYGVITKGKKGLTESQKKNVKAFFNKLKVNPNAKTNAKILPVKEIVAAFVTTKAFNDFIEKVGELVAEGLSLSVAMTQVSTEFIKDKIASPDELAQARKILSEEVNGLKEKKPLTEAQKQRNAAREELRKATSEYKEMEKLAKELEKERERVEKLRKEEAKKQSERIDKATNELLAAERKEAEKNAKELENKIKELSKEISQGKALQDQVEDIINEYLKMGAMDNTANQALIDLVKERLGITDEKQAVDVATKIAKSVVTNIREKLSKKWDADIKRQRAKETKEEKVKDPHKEVNDFVKGVALGSMGAEQFIELFGAKYGLETLTEQDFSKVRELAAKVRDAETKHRKAKALNDMVQYINSKAPVTLSQLFDELWYFKVLSPALTFFLGTADTNLTYNATQVYNTIFELPIQQLFTSLRNKAEIGKDKKGLKKAELIFADAIRNIAMGYAKAVIQRGNVKNVDILTKNAFLDVIKTEGFLKDSITYFKEVMTEGSGAFQEYESPFKAGAKTEFEIRRWFKLAKNGDMQAKRDIVNAMLNSGADALNLLVKSVPRSLAAGDLFFSAIIKNAYLPALVREYLIKNTDLRGEALNAEVSRILLNTDIELENAKQRAVENRMRLDIEIRPKMVGDKMTYEIYDKGKLVKGQIFDTKEEANEYARRVVAPKSPMYEMDVTDYLNVKIPTQAMLGANRLAGQAILGGSPPGMSGQLLKGFNYLNDIIGKGTTGLEDVSKSLMLKGEDTNLKYILTPTALTAKTLAVVISGLSRLMAFRRVGIMLARNYSNYVPPIGLLRYGMSYADKSALFIDYLPDQIPSDVERDKMLAQAILGTFITAISVTSILALKGLMDDDDDKDERIRKAIKNIQPGTLVGSLSDILTKDQIAAYKASGDIQEFSIFVELDKNGKRKWRSVKPDPKYSSALILATYAWNDIINKDDSGLKSAGLGLASFYNQIKEMGIGQGLPKLSNARSIGEFADIVAQTAFFDNLEITKIGLVTKLTQYLDRKKRLDPHWMDYVEDSDSYLQGTANYVMNEAIPFYNLGDAVRQPLSYGALGEEMYRTPSSEQGYISASISYLDSGKNKETRNMYRWLASNGYDKIFYPNVSDLKDAEGHEIKLSIFEKNRLGMLAAKASYLELKKKKADLEVVRQTGGTKAFRTEVEKIFRSNFNDVVQLVKKNALADAVEYTRKKNDADFKDKVEELKIKNKVLYGYDTKNDDGETIHVKGIIDIIKDQISNSEGKFVSFDEMDTFGTAIKEAKKNDKWNMITTNLNVLKDKYSDEAIVNYLSQLKELNYIEEELMTDSYLYIMGKKLKKSE